MTRSQVVEIFARHLALNLGRAATIGARLADAKMLPKKHGRAAAHLDREHLATLLIALAVDSGTIPDAPDTVAEFQGLRSHSGQKLGDAIAEMLASGAVADLVLCSDPPSAQIGSEAFGSVPPPSAAVRLRYLPAATLRAIARELAGRS